MVFVLKTELHSLINHFQRFFLTCNEGMFYFTYITAELMLQIWKITFNMLMTIFYTHCSHYQLMYTDDAEEKFNRHFGLVSEIYIDLVA